MMRRGFALPAALLAVLLIAALIAGAFNAVTEETRMGAAAADRQHALLSAESAFEVVISKEASPGDSIAIGETRSRQVEGLDVPVVVYVTRLDSSLYWLVADAGDTSRVPGIGRRIGIVVRARNGAAGSITIDRIPERGWSELF